MTHTAIEYSGDRRTVAPTITSRKITHARIMHSSTDKTHAAQASGYVNVAQAKADTATICNHHIPYSSFKHQLVAKFDGKTSDDIATKLPAAQAAITGTPALVPKATFGGNGTNYETEHIETVFDEFMATVINHKENLFYWPGANTRGDKSGTQLDYPLATSPNNAPGATALHVNNNLDAYRTKVENATGITIT